MINLSQPYMGIQVLLLGCLSIELALAISSFLCIKGPSDLYLTVYISPDFRETALCNARLIFILQIIVHLVTAFACLMEALKNKALCLF